ncbi:VacJ family lipoprotein [Neiella marina]|uniref:VacJ family lipoprotein n=1 Tax=Neiella holothuriorum TaxID=2870530 RepID=A0ABS7EEW7_9GAMM|nr:VacJ family lipoprotein [Neiella holothuriorum]MBW8190769.1 VacJ family lipoprotein [Neiella holothuriorum]
MKLKGWSALFISLIMVGNVHAGYENAEVQKREEARRAAYYANRIYDPRDPIEDLNRVFYRFNFNVLDPYFFRPLTVAYVDYVPELAREGINNFVLNFEEPSSAVNNLLQGKGGDSANNAGRFVINSTVGILGIVDVAQYFGMERKLDEFGEVLGYYGVSDGPYLMLPAMGPSSVREEAGDYVDNAYWPLAKIGFWPKLLMGVFKGLYARAQLLEQDGFLETSLDPYLLVKESYFQHVRYQVYDGQLPDVEAEDDAFLEDYLDEIDSM